MWVNITSTSIKCIDIYKSDQIEFWKYMQIGNLMCLVNVRTNWCSHLESNLAVSSKDLKYVYVIPQESQLLYSVFSRETLTCTKCLFL